MVKLSARLSLNTLADRFLTHLSEEKATLIELRQQRIGKRQHC